MNKKVSVVIPIYNAEKYLRRCIDSVLKQSFSNLDIVLIDDGSNDSSLNICLEYQDERIVLIHKENTGVSDTRNIGIQKACGEYITFVDADDWLDEKYIELLVDALEKNNSDISICSYQRITRECEQKMIDIGKKHEKVLSREVAMEYMICNENTTYLWGKLYKIGLFEKIKFPAGRIYAEDTAIMYQIFEKCEKIVYIDVDLYKYFDNNMANTYVNRNNPRIMFDIFMTWTEVYEFCKEKYPKLCKRCLKQMIHYYLRMYDSMKNFDKEKSRKTNDVVRRFIIKLIWTAKVKDKIKTVCCLIAPQTYIKKNK